MICHAVNQGESIMPANKLVQARIDGAKEEAAAVLVAMGLSVSCRTVVLTRIAREKALPFATPNTVTNEAMKEARRGGLLNSQIKCERADQFQTPQQRPSLVCSPQSSQIKRLSHHSPGLVGGVVPNWIPPRIREVARFPKQSCWGMRPFPWVSASLHPVNRAGF